MPDLTALENAAAKALRAREALYERRVASVLRKALDEIRAAMGVIYEKYAVDGILSKAAMTRYARYSAMETNIVSKMDPAIKASMATMKRLSPDQYQAAFFRSAWAIDNATGISLNWGIINTDAIKAAYAITDPENEAMAEALKNYSMKARGKIRVALNNGLAQGKSYQDMMRDIKDALNKTNFEAMRIIRTEGQGAIAAGTADAYDKALEDGVDGSVVWSATLDERTRDQHQEMDGQVRDAEGLFHFPNGETAPYPAWEGLSAEQRINCRCKLRFEVAGYSPQLRRTRDQGIIPYMPFNEWAKENGPIVR
jgi:SPP1 gp7 family putative phage head morphogenesis protein